MKNKVEEKDFPKAYTEEEKREQQVLLIAMLLSRRIEGRDWQRFPNPNQQKYQTKMLALARDVLKIVYQE